ncbi:hypothetical protein M885DRAFT_22150 [Pelagophyceae sp. CCMP2097]|nr:hypothetical protein M885DRAFT_22150 [Pelagophyceae sp. CCMP2097]
MYVAIEPIVSTALRRLRWVRAPGDNLALESAGGVKDSFREIEFAAGRVVELGPYDVENQRDAYNEKEASKAAASKAAMRTRRASPPPARAGREAFEGNPTQLLAALDDFADAAILADKQLKASRASRNADRASRDEALKAAMSASGGSRGADDESLLMEVVPRLATPMIAVRSVTKRRVSCFGGRHVLRVAVDVIYGAGGSHEALAHTALLRAELVQASETAAVFAKVEQGRDMVSDCAQRAAAGDAAFSLKLRFAAGQDDAPRVATFSLDEKRFFDSTNGATTAAKRTGRPRRGRTRRGGDDRGVEFTVLGGEDPSADDEDGAVVLLLRAVAAPILGKPRLWKPRWWKREL